MRSTIGIVALALAAGFFGGILSQQFARPAQASSAGVVAARDFRLVDASGAILAELAPVKYPKQSPTAVLIMHGPYNHDAQLRSEGLFFGRGYGKEDLGVGYADTNSPAVFFWYQQKGRMGLMLDANKAGAPSMFMYDAKGSTIWQEPEPTTKP